MVIEIYTRTSCPYCIQAKDVLTQNGHVYTEYVIGVDIDRQDVLKKYPYASLLPLIIIDGQHIGGFPELLDKLFPALEN